MSIDKILGLWRNEVWANTHHVITDDPNRPPFFWFGQAWRDYQHKNKPINIWDTSDSYLFRVWRMGDIAVPAGVACGLATYFLKTDNRLAFEKWSRKENTAISIIRDLPIKGVLASLPKPIMICWAMGASWAVAASMSTDYWTKNLNSPWNYNVAGMAAALTHHVLAGGTYSEPYYKKLPDFTRKANNRTLTLLLFLPLLGAALRYNMLINEYENDFAGFYDGLGGPTDLSDKDKILLQPKKSAVSEDNVAWLYPAQPKELAADSDYTVSYGKGFLYDDKVKSSE